MSYNINVRENRRGNQEWTIQRHCHRLGTQDTGRRQKKTPQNQPYTENIKMSNTDPRKKTGVNPGALEG